MAFPQSQNRGGAGDAIVDQLDYMARLTQDLVDSLEMIRAKTSALRVALQMQRDIIQDNRDRVAHFVEKGGAN